MISKGEKINDRYQIIKNIGEGGMANVYLAMDTILNRKVAVKVLRGDLADDPKFVRRFQREALSASSLSHPNIVEMYDVGEDNGKYYIIMEYIEGRTLKQLIKKRGTLTISEVVDIMIQLSSGLAHAHEGYIIHRDVKPQNIMILEDGGVKITDFGIATALNATQLTQTNSIMGSVHYLPPEQASGNGSTTRSDIYSLGIMMYELLTGLLPFKGDNAVEIALKHLKEEVPSIKEINNSIPQSIENVIIKSTAKNPKNRYNDATEMHNDLLTVLDGSRLNEPVYKYKFPEKEEEKRKPKEKNKKKGRERIAVPIKDNYKKGNKLMIALFSFLAILIVGFFGVFILFPTLSKTPEVKIPDVSNMTVLEAESKLKELDFKVAAETKQVNSDNIEVGNIVRTNPIIGRTVKEGTIITLYESIGMLKLILEDYTDLNYLEIKAKLETEYKINVVIEKEETTDKKIEDGTILNQEPLEGITLKKGQTLTLYVADKVDEYPDMLEEEWFKSDVELLAEENNLIVTYEYVETDEYTENRVLSQSRPAQTKVVIGSTLKVTIATPIEEGSDD